ncbi:olfactory receptor 1496-like [Lithobates pipiens]
MNGQLTNSTSNTGFHILAFSTSENGQFLLLAVILLVYLIILIGNNLILTLVCLVPQLHTSMYFFLSNLSVVDNLYVSTTVPKLLYITNTGDHFMSYNACMAQLYYFLFFADTESFLLTAMAVDRYVAICFPLHYAVIMNRRVCVLLAFPAWFMAAVNALILTSFAHDLTFTGIKEVDNFFCDLKALLTVSSSDTHFLRGFILVDGMFIGAVPMLLILTSYARIISTILKIKSSVGRKKKFFSCTSHIIIVVVYYGSALCLYMQYSLHQDKVFAVMFITLVPMLNPIVYSLRNKDITRVIQRTVSGIRTMPAA